MLVRLFFVSLLVGAIMMWLNISPEQIFFRIEQALLDLWNMGFGALREIIRYVIAGAIIVIPAWIILRLLNLRG